MNQWLFVFVACMVFSAPSLARRRNEEQPAPVDSTAPASPAVTNKAQSVTTPRTFLDTINKGREYVLTDSDLKPEQLLPQTDASGDSKGFIESDITGSVSDGPALVSPQPKPALQPSQSAAPKLSTANSESFRIQCLASTQLSAVNSAKKTLEGKTSYPVTVVSVPPNYKLMVGNFKTRAEADRALYDVRGLGYPEAWVAKVTAE